MIPRAHVTAWRASAPWPSDAQIEQDLVLSRALVEMFSRPAVAKVVAFRGGGALHKLFLKQPVDLGLEKLRFGVIPKKVGGSAARGQVYFVCIRNLLKFDQIFIRQES